MAAKIVFLCAFALFAQTVLAQSLGYGSAGLVGVGLSNTGLLGTGFGGGAGLVATGLGNAGLIGTGLGNVGLVEAGLGSAGLIGAGLSNTGIIGTGLGLNTGLTGVTFNLGGLSIGSSSPLVVTNISPIGPSGLAVASENVIDGTLLVSGSLPFLSAVAFEGTLPTAGSGIATCGCGNGAVGIINV